MPSLRRQRALYCSRDGRPSGALFSCAGKGKGEKKEERFSLWTFGDAFTTLCRNLVLGGRNHARHRHIAGLASRHHNTSHDLHAHTTNAVPRRIDDAFRRGPDLNLSRSEADADDGLPLLEDADADADADAASASASSVEQADPVPSSPPRHEPARPV